MLEAVLQQKSLSQDIEGLVELHKHSPGEVRGSDIVSTVQVSLHQGSFPLDFGATDSKQEYLCSHLLPLCSDAEKAKVALSALEVLADQQGFHRMRFSRFKADRDKGIEYFYTHLLPLCSDQEKSWILDIVSQGGSDVYYRSYSYWQETCKDHPNSDAEVAGLVRYVLENEHHDESAVNPLCWQKGNRMVGTCMNLANLTLTEVSDESLLKILSIDEIRSLAGYIAIFHRKFDSWKQEACSGGLWSYNYRENCDRMGNPLRKKIQTLLTSALESLMTETSGDRNFSVRKALEVKQTLDDCEPSIEELEQMLATDLIKAELYREYKNLSNRQRTLCSFSVFLERKISAGLEGADPKRLLEDTSLHKVFDYWSEDGMVSRRTNYEIEARNTAVRLEKLRELHELVDQVIRSKEKVPVI